MEGVIDVHRVQLRKSIQMVTLPDINPVQQGLTLVNRQEPVFPFGANRTRCRVRAVPLGPTNYEQGIHVVVKNVRLEISPCRFADHVKNATVPNYVAHVRHDYFSSFKQSVHNPEWIVKNKIKVKMKEQNKTKQKTKAK